MYDGPIIDAHHHIWEVRHYPWLLAPMSPKIFGYDYEPLRHDYLIDDLLADFGDHDVVGSVHVQAHYDPTNPVGETAWLQGVADVAGFPQAIVGHASIAAADVATMLAAHRAYENFRGIRDVVYWHPDRREFQAVERPDYCLAPAFRRGLALLEEYGLKFELQGFANQFDYFAELVAGHPGLDFCLVHAGLLTADDDATFAAWQRALDALVPHDNLFIKCSGANNVNRGAVRTPQVLARQYNTLIDIFGAARCFFGSNFPVEKLRNTYDDLIAACKQALDARSTADQRQFFHDTAARFYRI